MYILFLQSCFIEEGFKSDMSFHGFAFIFPLMFVLVFSLVAFTFIVTLVRGASEWNRNNHSPKLNVEATCVSKRTNVTHHSESVANDFSGRMDIHTHRIQLTMLRLKWRVVTE